MEVSISLSAADVERIADAITAKLSGQPAAGAAADGKVLWREDEAAACLGISPHTLKKFRLRGYIQAATADRPVLYRREHLEAAAEFLTKG